MTQRMPAQPPFDKEKNTQYKHEQFSKGECSFYWKFVNIETPAVALELL